MPDAAGRPRGRPKTFDRGHVIDVAMRCYWRDGVGDVSLNEVCRRAEVSKPGLYREFGGEDGLTDAALERYVDTVLLPLYEVTTRDRPFRDVLATLIGLTTDPDRPTPRGCLLAQMRMSPSRLGPRTRARADAARRTALSSYTAWVDRAKARGEVAASVSTDVAAQFIDTQFTTLLLEMALGEDPALLRAQARLAFAGLVDELPPPVGAPGG